MSSAGKAKEKDVIEALQFLASLEFDPETMPEFGLTEEACEEVKEIHKEEIERAVSLLRAFAEQIRPQTLEMMQRVYYSIINGETFQENVYQKATAVAYLNEAWNGVGPWRM